MFRFLNHIKYMSPYTICVKVKKKKKSGYRYPANVLFLSSSFPLKRDVNNFSVFIIHKLFLYNRILPFKTIDKTHIPCDFIFHELKLV